MTTDSLNVLAIGNAIVDVLARVHDDFLDTHGMVKASMALVDGGQAETIYGQMGETLETSGGSAANTAAGIAALGGQVQYIGRVRNDPPGATFLRQHRTLRAPHDTPATTEGAPTARRLLPTPPP